MIVESETSRSDGQHLSGNDVPSTAPTVHAVIDGGISRPSADKYEAAVKVSPPTESVITKKSSIENDESSTLTTENCSSNNEDIGETEELNDEPQKTFPQKVSQVYFILTSFAQIALFLRYGKRVSDLCFSFMHWKLNAVAYGDAE